MKRFVLLGNRRTGSTVVGNALADHPQVLFYGEIFHKVIARRSAEAGRRTLGAGVKRSLPNGIPVCLDSDSGYEYLKGLFSQELAYRAIGFKIFYFQAREGSIASAWDLLAEQRDIAIIHLLRSNFLESLVSFYRARRSGIWHVDTPTSTAPFSLTPTQCLDFFEEHERWSSVTEPLLNAHPVLEVEYDEIKDDFQSTMSRIFTFLDLSADVSPTVLLKKIAQKSLQEELLNYRELRQYFQATAYARYFP